MVIESYSKDDTARLLSSRQRKEYYIGVNNTGLPFVGKGFKEKEGPNNYVSRNGKVMEL